MKESGAALGRTPKQEVQMAIKTTVIGSYPKPPDEGQTFGVRSTLHKLERGEATVDDLKAAQDELARRSSRNKRTPASTS